MNPLKIFFSCCFLLASTVYAEEAKIHPFQTNSYQHILDSHKDKPLVLVIWSVTCSSCLSEMKQIQKIHQDNPKLNIVMLSVDGPEYRVQMQSIIAQEKLSELEQWGFSEDNSSALRYAIDSRWYGELPRTYFYNKAHKRTGISGVLNHVQFQQQLETIMD